MEVFCLLRSSAERMQRVSCWTCVGCKDVWCVQMRPSAWSHALGLDSYAGPNVTAGVPTLASTHNGSTPSGYASCTLYVKCRLINKYLEPVGSSFIRMYMVLSLQRHIIVHLLMLEGLRGAGINSEQANVVLPLTSSWCFSGGWLAHQRPTKGGRMACRPTSGPTIPRCPLVPSTTSGLPCCRCDGAQALSVCSTPPS